MVLRLGVKDMLGLPFKKSTTGQALQAWSGRCRLKLCYLFGGFIVMGDDSEDLAVVLTDVTLFGACRVLPRFRSLHQAQAEAP